VLAKGKRVVFPWGNSPCHPTTTAIFGIRGFIYFNLGGVQWGLLHVTYLYRISVYFISTVPRVPFTIILRLLMPYTLSMVVGARCSILRSMLIMVL
jgi:hypothetical protein